jgi:DNA-directed RNA polymerase specialized sigma24 family protein
VVDFLHAATLASLQSTPRRALPTPPTEPGLAERAALAICLAPFLATLTREQAEALTLIDLDGFTLNAAAERVGTDRPTFQGRLQRARIRMRQLLSACLSAAPPECTAA